MIVKMPIIPEKKTGIVGKISVKVGQKVGQGEILAQVETAKGNRPIKSGIAGTVVSIYCEEGQEILTDDQMFEIEEINPTICSELVDDDVQEINTDLAVIGAGPGGYVAVIYAAKKGLKVTLIEKSELGGTCLNVGCIPTKSMIESAHVFEKVKEAEIFGVLAQEPSIDLEKVVERKNQVRDRLVGGIDFLLKKNQVEVIKGVASFENSEMIGVVGEEKYRVHAKNFIIATGSKVASLPIEGMDYPFVLDSSQMLENTQLPKSLTIIGGGVIGMEFAFMYRSFGVDVQVVEYFERVLTMMDSDLSKSIMREAKRARIKIHTGAKVTRIEKGEDNQGVVVFEDKKGERKIFSDLILSATGRKPNLDHLKPECAGVEVDERASFIPVNEHMQTNVQNIYAIGDVTNIMQLAHVASHQAITAVDNILGNHKSMRYNAVPNVVFTSPEMASVGVLEDQLKEQGVDYTVGKFNFAGNGKALTMNQDGGYLKLLKDKESGKILGASIIGVDASNLIATITLAIENGLTEEEIIKTIFAHPTTAEVIHEAALDLTLGAIHQ